MAKPTVRGLKSVVMTSQDPDKTARFYIDVLSMPLEKEEHGMAVHWACQFGGLHFAIHHQKGFWLEERIEKGAEHTFLAFTIEDIDAFLQHLKSHGVAVVAQRDIGPMKFVAFHDPDGRRVSCGTPWPGT